MGAQQNTGQAQGQAPVGGDEVFGGQQDPQVGQTGGQTPQQADPGQSQGQQTPATPAAGQPLSKDDIAEIVRSTATSLAATQRAQQPPQQQAQMSPEEFNKVFNVFNPSEELVNDILAGGQKGLTALQTIVAGAVKQATTMAAYHARVVREDLLEQVTPIQRYYAEQQEKQLFSEFLEKNPDLKGFETVIRHVSAAVRSSGRQFASKDEAFKFVADEVRNVRTSIGGGQGAQGQGQQGQQQQPSQGQGSNMAQLSSGGSMRPSGGGSQRRVEGPPGLEVFD